MQNIYLRTDGDSIIGYGHIYRMLAMAEILENDKNCTFILGANSEKSMIPRRFKQIICNVPIGTSAEINWITENLNSKNGIIILDGYQFSIDYQRELKKLGFKVIYVSDSSKEKVCSDIVINHSPQATSDWCSSEVDTLYAFGIDYALIRDAFLRHTDKTRKISNITRVFVCTGGSDTADINSKIITGLLNFSQIKTINLLASDRQILSSVLDTVKHDSRVAMHSNLGSEEVASLLLNSDLAILSASTILYEALCIKLPILCGYFTENQKNIYEGFKALEVFQDLKTLRTFDHSHFSSSVDIILKKGQSFYSEMMKKQSMIFNTGIKERYLRLIDNLC